MYVSAAGDRVTITNQVRDHFFSSLSSVSFPYFLLNAMVFQARILT